MDGPAVKRLLFDSSDLLGELGVQPALPKHSFGLTDPQRHSRYLLVLVRVLESEEGRNLGLARGTNLAKIITARDMNQGQRRY
jgi:hypothetical protein